MWRCGGLKKSRKEHNVVAAIKSGCIACTLSAPGPAGEAARGRAGRGGTGRAWGVFRAEGRPAPAPASVVVGHSERARTHPAFIHDRDSAPSEHATAPERKCSTLKT